MKKPLFIIKLGKYIKKKRIERLIKRLELEGKFINIKAFDGRRRSVHEKDTNS